jgi:hypothetical protein
MSNKNLRISAETSQSDFLINLNANPGSETP